MLLLLLLFFSPGDEEDWLVASFVLPFRVPFQVAEFVKIRTLAQGF